MNKEEAVNQDTDRMAYLAAPTIEGIVAMYEALTGKKATKEEIAELEIELTEIDQ